jgi:putative hydrolase of the HAD superfamily
VTDGKAILWDFDGTLAHHRQRWGGCFIQVLDDRFPGHSFTLDDARPLLAKGYPWHTPEHPHLDLCDPEDWWRSLETNLASAYAQLGYSDTDLMLLARSLRELYTQPEGFELYDDVVPVLSSLRESGWHHYILSNHMPELRDICTALGLDHYFDAIINSAETGYEKPHPEASASPKRPWARFGRSSWSGTTRSLMLREPKTRASPVSS